MIRKKNIFFRTKELTEESREEKVEELASHGSQGQRPDVLFLRKANR